MPHFPKPFFKKSRGVWYVEIKRKQINLGADRDSAFERYHELMSSRSAQPTNDEDLLAVSVVDSFLDWVKYNRSPDTFEWYRFRLQRFVDAYPEIRATKLLPYHVEQWVATFHDISITTRRNYLRSVKRCFSWAKKQGYFEQNPIADLEIPSGKNREITIEQAEFDNFLSFVRNDAFCDLVLVAWETGCRPQEILRVEARHVDLKNQRWVFPKSESKMKRTARVIYLSDKALEITKRQCRRYAAGKLFRNSNGKPWNKSSANCQFSATQLRMGKVEMRRRNIEVSEHEIERLIGVLEPNKVERGVTRPKRPAEIREEAKRKLVNKVARSLAPRYCLYAIRHAFCTNALKRGVDPLTVALLLGHSDPSTLAKTYQHLSLSPEHLLEKAKAATC